MRNTTGRISDMVKKVSVPDLSSLQREIILRVEPIIEKITDEKKTSC